MAYRWLEEVTCDRCGGVFVFEKFRTSEGERHLFRWEDLNTWLTDLGWKFSDGLRKGQFCPTCSQRM